MSIYEEDLNRTRLECKGNSEIRWGGIDMIDLNRTRLECKVHSHAFFTSKSATIWIEPDWNVKSGSYRCQIYDYTIWIEPDWNVKLRGNEQLEHYKTIWIEPDWNVKRKYLPR